MWIRRSIEFFLVIGIICMSPFVPKTNAQMMRTFPTINPSITLSPEDKQEISEGQELYQQLQNNQTSCNKLNDDDFDKIGEFVMEQQIGNSDKHAQMNQMTKSMMGEQDETNMHITLGKRTTRCGINAGGNGDGWNMMGGWPGSMMGWYGFKSWSIFTFLFSLAGFVVLVLLGILLLKQIRKK